jgi:hypothetical protein
MNIKTQFQHNVSWRAFYGNRTGPTRVGKIVRRRFIPRSNAMHYVTRRSNQMQKHKFDVTYPGALFVESIPVPPEHEE